MIIILLCKKLLSLCRCYFQAEGITLWQKMRFPGIDPKSVVCAFFKQGQCTKGDKCKFSHDLSIERKAEKRSLYCDMRDDDKEMDTMDKWDEDKLKEVVEKKHGSGNRPTTDIVSYTIHNFLIDICEYIGL